MLSRSVQEEAEEATGWLMDLRTGEPQNSQVVFTGKHSKQKVEKAAEADKGLAHSTSECERPAFVIEGTAAMQPDKLLKMTNQGSLPRQGPTLRQNFWEWNQN